MIDYQDETVELTDGEASRQRYQVKKGKPIDPPQLPPALLSMLLVQLQELAQSGEGFRTDWEKF